MGKTNNNQERLTAEQILEAEMAAFKTPPGYLEYTKEDFEEAKQEGAFEPVINTAIRYAAQEVAFNLKAQDDFYKGVTDAYEKRLDELQQQNIRLLDALSEAQSGILASQTMQDLKRQLEEARLQNQKAIEVVTELQKVHEWLWQNCDRGLIGHSDFFNMNANAQQLAIDFLTQKGGDQ